LLNNKQITHRSLAACALLRECLNGWSLSHINVMRARKLWWTRGKEEGSGMGFPFPVPGVLPRDSFWKYRCKSFCIFMGVQDRFVHGNGNSQRGLYW